MALMPPWGPAAAAAADASCSFYNYDHSLGGSQTSSTTTTTTTTTNTPRTTTPDTTSSKTPSHRSSYPPAATTTTTTGNSTSADSTTASHWLDLHHRLSTETKTKTKTTVVSHNKISNNDRNNNDDEEMEAQRCNGGMTTPDQNHTPKQGHLQQAPLLRTGGTAFTAPRSLTSANWRSAQAAALTQQQLLRDVYSGPFDSNNNNNSNSNNSQQQQQNQQNQQQNHHYSHSNPPPPPPAAPLRPASFHANSSQYNLGNMLEHHQQQQQQQQLRHSGITTISDSQLDAAFAYCLDRGNGQYTRLIPADTLPALRDVPATQLGSAGMVVLPKPRGLPPGGYNNNTTEHVAWRTPPATPETPADNIQSRIDNIVNSTPPTPTHAHHHKPSTASSSSSSATINAGPTPGGGPVPYHLSGPIGGGGGMRRPKVYCDKWVHEGVCAFTQQGCRFKHEMPFDKLTQQQLGLHGLPAWWKKYQAELARQRDVLLPGVGGGVGVGVGGGSVQNEDEANNSALVPTAAGVNYAVLHPAQQGQNLEFRLGLERERFAWSEGGGLNGMGGGLGGAGNMAWRRSGDYTPLDVQTSRLRLDDLGGGLRTHNMGNTLNTQISYGSPYGPIAPPARAPTAAHPSSSLSSASATTGANNFAPPRSGVNIHTSNPFELLQNLEEKKSTTPENKEAWTKNEGARLGY